jgi:hypothetical protein
MARWREELAALRARVDQLEKEVQHLRAATELARPLLDDAGRLAGWAEEARRLNEATSAAADTMRALTAAAGIGQPRFRPRLNKVYQAKTPGYVGVGFVGGRTGRVEIVVGASNPPTQPVTWTWPDGYAGTIVRAGEYWMLRAQDQTLGYRCVFGPLF